jgi:hypothetical protein
MANELPWASAWLYSKLEPIVTTFGLTHVEQGITVKRVVEGVAPATWPPSGTRLTFHNQSPGSDRYTVSGDRSGLDPLYLVRVIGQVRSWSTLAPIADAIDAALHGASGVAGSGHVIRCRRESAYNAQDPQDPAYWHLGGFYRLYIGA